MCLMGYWVVTFFFELMHVANGRNVTATAVGQTLGLVFKYSIWVLLLLATMDII
jgi:hypothetical protein